MKQFIEKYRNKITGTLSGFDRIVFRGIFRNLIYAGGMAIFLNFKRILLKDFDEYVKTKTTLLRSSLYNYIEQSERPSIYLPSSNKESSQKSVVRSQEVFHLIMHSPAMVRFQFYKAIVTVPFMTTGS